MTILIVVNVVLILMLLLTDRWGHPIGTYNWRASRRLRKRRGAIHADDCPHAARKSPAGTTAQGRTPKVAHAKPEIPVPIMVSDAASEQRVKELYRERDRFKAAAERMESMLTTAESAAEDAAAERDRYREALEAIWNDPGTDNAALDFVTFKDIAREALLDKDGDDE